MNGYDAQDMATQGAEGFRNGYQAGYADAVKAVEVGKPAAAQEAVVWGIRIGASDSWGYTNNEEQADFLGKQSGLPYEKKPLYAAPVATAPVDLDAHGLRALDNCIADLRRLLELSQDYDLDVMQMQSLETAIESMELRKVASTPAAPGIELEQFRIAVQAYQFRQQEFGSVAGIAEGKRLLALIDASPKSRNIPAPRIELTNGQIAQLADFAGTPTAGTPLDEQDVLVIQHANAGHSGTGLYAHYDELPEEGAIYLDGQFPGAPRGGSDALARAYGYLWHVNHPEDIPTGHPYMSADRAAVEARKELRDMLTHEQRGEGINCVRQKLLTDMQATSAKVGA